MEAEVGLRSSLLSSSTTEVIASDMLLDNQLKDVFARSITELSDSEGGMQVHSIYRSRRLAWHLLHTKRSYNRASTRLHGTGIIV